MEYNNPPGRLHKPASTSDFTQVYHESRQTLKRAPSAPVRSRYRETAPGGHIRRGTLPDLNIAESDKQQQQQHQQIAASASANDLHRLSEASGELLAAPHITELRPDSLAIFSSHSLATLSPHPRPLENPKPIPTRPPQLPRAQTTGRLSLRHTFSTRGLKRPSIIGLTTDMDAASPRSGNGSGSDGTASPRQRYSDEIKQKKKNGLGSFMAGLMKTNSRPAISAPANPLHVVHVGVDSATGEFTVCLTHFHSHSHPLSFCTTSMLALGCLLGMPDLHSPVMQGLVRHWLLCDFD